MAGHDSSDRGATRGGPPLPARTAYLLGEIGRIQAIRFSERLGPLGLRPKQFALLNLVALDEGSSQQRLAARLALEPSGLVGTIDELEREGLIERRRDPSDRRRHALRLTPAGRERLLDARRAAARRAAELLEPLSEKELQTLHDLLRRIARAEGIDLLATLTVPKREES